MTPSVIRMNTSLSDTEEAEVKRRVFESYLSLLGLGLGGGLFLIIIVVGVIIWITREEEEEAKIKEDQERLRD